MHHHQREEERKREEEHKREAEHRREEERERELEQERNAEMELAGQMDRALALLQPQPNKEICPPMMCWLGNRKRKVTWIMCDVCDQ